MTQIWCIIKTIFCKNPFLGFKTVLLITAAIALMLLDNYLPQFKPIKNAITNIAAPFEYLVNLPITSIQTINIAISSKNTLLGDNTKLRAELFILKAKIQKLEALEQENIKLRGLVGSTKLTKDKFLITQLIAINPNSFNRQIVIDKGKRNHVYVGQVVLDAYGLAGRVISVGLNTSIVLLITDAKSAIPVQINRNGLRAIAIGNGNEDALELVQIPITSDVRRGDSLVTAEVKNQLPQGYPVGIIKNVKHIPGERFLQIFVAPSAHVSSTNQFLLIWPKQSVEAVEQQKQK